MRRQNWKLEFWNTVLFSSIKIPVFSMSFHVSERYCLYFPNTKCVCVSKCLFFLLMYTDFGLSACLKLHKRVISTGFTSMPLIACFKYIFLYGVPHFLLGPCVPIHAPKVYHGGDEYFSKHLATCSLDSGVYSAEHFPALHIFQHTLHFLQLCNFFLHIN